ncbi:MAG: hypothetical protein K2X87_00225 [Gemmataceae bacterium]|nr:hypothetical protein [Gemmataceae bacterium]
MNGPSFAATAPPPAARPPRAPAARPAKPDPDAGAGLRVLTYLRLHWLTVLFCGTLVGGAGSYAAWELLPAKWESTAILQVDQTPASVASANNPNQTRTEFATYVKTAAALLRSQYVLNAALRDGGIADLPTIKGQKDPIKFLTEELQVLTRDGSEVIEVTLAGHDPADVKKIVDAVQKAFMKEVSEKDNARRALLLKRIQDAHADMLKQLQNRAGKPDVTAKGPTDPAVQQATLTGEPNKLPPVGGPAGPAPVVALPPPDPLALLLKHDPHKVVEEYARLTAAIAQLPAQVQALRKQADGHKALVKELGSAPITNPLVLAGVEADPEVQAQARAAKDARFQYDFAHSAAADKNCRDVQTKRAIWEAQKAQLEQVRLRKANLIEGATRVPAMKAHAEKAAELTQEADKLEARLQAARAAEPGLAKVLAELPPARPETARVSAAGRPEKEPYTPEDTDKLVQDSVFGGIAKNLYNLKVELSTLDRVRVFQPASVPIQKDSKKQILATVAAGLLGYVLLAVGLVGYETLTRRVSSLSDIASAGPAPVVGVIPYRPGAAGRDPARQAAAAEAVDKLRAYVGQTWLARGATSVAVTSPVGDEGKGLAALGLADSLARAGYKTLLIDFDLRDPSLHTLAGVPNSAGVCEALRGEIVDARDAVVSLPTGLDLLPAGAWSEAAGRAAVGRRLDELLVRLKEPYDCVVVNTHAILAAADAVEVSRRCEAVLVCAQYRETTVPLLRRATDRVAAMEVPYGGVVYVGATDKEALC